MYTPFINSLKLFDRPNLSDQTVLDPVYASYAYSAIAMFRQLFSNPAIPTIAKGPITLDHLSGNPSRLWFQFLSILYMMIFAETRQKIQRKSVFSQTTWDVFNITPSCYFLSTLHRVTKYLAIKV